MLIPENAYIDRTMPRLAAAPALPTIGDVARRAGVSNATVSRVVNLPGSVRPELRHRVEAAVAQLGYMPHAGARTLRSRRTGTIGAIFPTIDNAIFAKAIDALQRRLAEAGHQLLIATHGYSPAIEESQALNLLTRGADALLLCGVGQRASAESTEGLQAAAAESTSPPKRRYRGSYSQQTPPLVARRRSQTDPNRQSIAWLENFPDGPKVLPRKLWSALQLAVNCGEIKRARTSRVLRA